MNLARRNSFDILTNLYGDLKFNPEISNYQLKKKYGYHYKTIKRARRTLDLFGLLK